MENVQEDNNIFVTEPVSPQRKYFDLTNGRTI